MSVCGYGSGHVLTATSPPAFILVSSPRVKFAHGPPLFLSLVLTADGLARSFSAAGMR